MTTLKQIVETKNACSIPWLHTEISLQDQTVRPCCKYSETVGDLKTEFPVIWVNEPYQELRRKFANGTMPEQCSACNFQSDSFSYKNLKNESYKSLTYRSIESVELPHIFHITLNNACNLSCRMCTPGQSSKLYQYAQTTELKKFYTLRPLDNSVNLEKLRGSFKNATSVTITGGEPLINESTYELIQLIQSESTRLKVVTLPTNLTVFNKRLLNHLDSLDRIDINLYISLDGPEHINNYIRHGSDWNHIKENLLLIRKQYPRFNIGINSTISAFNVGYLPELLLSLNQLQTATDTKFVKLLVSAVLDDHVHAGVLPDYIKEFYKEKLLKFDMSQIDIDGSELVIPTALELINKDYSKHYEKFIDFVKTFDKVAHTDFYSVYKEFGTTGEIRTPDSHVRSVVL